MKVLIVTPALPYPNILRGADAQDRVYGIQLLAELGVEVSVVAKMLPGFGPNAEREISESLGGIPVEIVPYAQRGFFEKLGSVFQDARLLDGAALEYTDPATREAVSRAIERVRPDAVWFDASALWPLMPLARGAGARVISRPVTVESRNVLEEGLTPPNLLRSFIKDFGERALAVRADTVVAITPDEAAFYRRVGARDVHVLPLRALPRVLEQPPVHVNNKESLRVLYSGAAYTVAHNRDTARMIIEQIVPRIEAQAPGIFSFHITGGKLPADLANAAARLGNVTYEGFVPDYDAFASTMDIALAPSTGAGMQQKVFEPLCRGLPTITTKNGIAGYPLVHDRELCIADTPAAMVEMLLRLRDPLIRQRLSTAGRTAAEKLFSRTAARTTLRAILKL